MRCYLLCCTIALCCIAINTTAQVRDAAASSNAIPIPYTHVPPHLLVTQLSFSAGTGRLSKDDKPLLSLSGEAKGLYNITGALYVSSGAGFNHLRSQGTETSGDKTQRNASLLYLPTGIGFSLGDDNATILTGIDVLPGYYFNAAPDLGNRRQLTFGIGPEFGFLFKAGPAYTKGLLIGFSGKLQFMQLPDGDDRGRRYVYGGVGLVLRFY